MWDWQGGDCYFVDNADFNGSNSQSNEGENIYYICDGEKTPVRGVIEHAYLVENTENKRENQWNEPCSQSKRRRVLQFDSEVIDDEANSSALTTSNGARDSVNEVLSQISSWLCEDADGESLPCNEILDKSFEGWLSSCLTDTDMEFSPHQSSVHNMANDRYQRELNTMPERQGRESTTMPDRPIRVHHNSNFQGKQSFIRTSDISSTSVVYPFTFLKPSGFRGELTLKDINRRIHAPPKSQEDHITYSTFSGKPVVAKTKICTEGGKGSITIMRTKG